MWLQKASQSDEQCKRTALGPSSLLPSTLTHSITLGESSFELIKNDERDGTVHKNVKSAACCAGFFGNKPLAFTILTHTSCVVWVSLRCGL